MTAWSRLRFARSRALSIASDPPSGRTCRSWDGKHTPGLSLPRWDRPKTHDRNGENRIPSRHIGPLTR